MLDDQAISTFAREKTIALVGNPNTGKSTLFNALTGFHQRVGNFPGVTVEKKTGLLRAETGGCQVRVVDLPGAYSLTAHSADETVVLEALAGRSRSVAKPDLIVCVIDAGNLRRNLFFVSQLLELDTPLVVALNMIDLAEASGIRIDTAALADRLGVPVVPVVASKRTGIDALTRVMLETQDKPASDRCAKFPDCVCRELDELREVVNDGAPDGHAGSSNGGNRAELLQTLLDPGGYHEQKLGLRCGRSLAQDLAQRRQRITLEGESLIELEAQVRYAWIDKLLEQVVTRPDQLRASRSEWADLILTHRFFGLAIFLLMMACCFQAIYAWAAPIIDTVDATFAAIGSAMATLLPQGALQSLLTNGLVAGVGAVLAFLPQILILFLFIAILEDCGYMARAAFLLDRWMAKLGLSGKSFIPLLSSFACAVPGILATRTIEDRRSRFITILIAPLMSCSARLPVYALMISAFIPNKPLLGRFVGMQAATLLAMYCVGAIVAVAIALLLRKTAFRGEPAAFLMELPKYKWPTPSTVFFRMYEQGREFCVTAGTIIVAVSIVIWALGYYPHPPAIARAHDAMRQAARSVEQSAEQRHAELVRIDHEEAGAYLRNSLLGRAGAFIEPAVKPLGWDWRVGTAVIASFPAREIMIASMGTIYNLGGDQDERSTGLREKLQRATWPNGSPVFGVPVALSVMAFFALCCQCGATLAAIRRETGSWRWPLVSFVYMTSLAYVAALATYQIASRLA
ncbi:MAG: ferrous iron transport protein B [Phycisphaerae bacterium]